MKYFKFGEMYVFLEKAREEESWSPKTRAIIEWVFVAVLFLFFYILIAVR
jgi:hypothetical protein